LRVILPEVEPFIYACVARRIKKGNIEKEIVETIRKY